MDTWLFYMFIVSSDWSKVLKHSLPSSPSLLEVSCKAFSEGVSTAFMSWCSVHSLPSLSTLLGSEGMIGSSQVRSSPFHCMSRIVLITILKNQLWFIVEMAET